MLMLMGEENNSDIKQITTPTQPNPVSTAPQTTLPTQVVPQVVSVPPPKKLLRLRNIAIVLVLLMLFGAATTTAYFVGKSHQLVIIKAPARPPINLPTQTVVVANCTVGYGKQYILPKDIPVGPIYDVVNDKVIAIEYNFAISDLLTNSDAFSDPILKITRDYPVDHLSIVPVIPKPGEVLKSVHLILFVVSKAEAKAITCPAPKT